MDLYKLNNSSQKELVIEADGSELHYRKSAGSPKKWILIDGTEPEDLANFPATAKQATLELLHKFGENLTVCIS